MNNNYVKFETEDDPILIFTDRFNGNVFIQTMGHNGYISKFMTPEEAKRMAKYILYDLGESKEKPKYDIIKCPMRIAEY